MSEYATLKRYVDWPFLRVLRLQKGARGPILTYVRVLKWQFHVHRIMP